MNHSLPPTSPPLHSHSPSLDPHHFFPSTFHGPPEQPHPVESSGCCQGDLWRYELNHVTTFYGFPWLKALNSPGEVGGLLKTQAPGCHPRLHNRLWNDCLRAESHAVGKQVREGSLTVDYAETQDGWNLADSTPLPQPASTCVLPWPLCVFLNMWSCFLFLGCGQYTGICIFRKWCQQKST